MAQGNVEIWLGKLLNMALRSVHAVIRNAIVAIQDPNFELMEFLSSYPAQVSILSMLHSGISYIHIATCVLAIDQENNEYKNMLLQFISYYKSKV